MASCLTLDEPFLVRCEKKKKKDCVSSVCGYGKSGSAWSCPGLKWSSVESYQSVFFKQIAHPIAHAGNYHSVPCSRTQFLPGSEAPLSTLRGEVSEVSQSLNTRKSFNISRPRPLTQYDHITTAVIDEVPKRATQTCVGPWWRCMPSVPSD